jgi:Protein of unknown function (DUF1579)
MKLLRRLLFNVLFLLLIGGNCAAQDSLVVAMGKGKPLSDRTLNQRRMLSIAETNEHHKVLEGTVGQWSFQGKHTFPGGFEVGFSGTAEKKKLWNGRFFITETIGKPRALPWYNGEMITYKDMIIEGYDNISGRYVMSTFHNETDTDIQTIYGLFDTNTKTFRYEGDVQSHTHSDIPAGTTIHWRSEISQQDTTHFQHLRTESVNGKEILRTEIKFTKIK